MDRGTKGEKQGTLTLASAIERTKDSLRKFSGSPLADDAYNEIGSSA
jgi:hypothetical protein